MQCLTGFCTGVMHLNNCSIDRFCVLVLCTSTTAVLDRFCELVLYTTIWQTLWTSFMQKLEYLAYFVYWLYAPQNCSIWQVLWTGFMLFNNCGIWQVLCAGFMHHDDCSISQRRITVSHSGLPFQLITVNAISGYQVRQNAAGWKHKGI